MAGLYGAIGIGILAALFGGTPTQVSGRQIDAPPKFGDDVDEM